MQIANKKITSDSKPFVIAEVAQSHEGSLGNAFAFVDVAKACGVDAIKFQTHIADQESTANDQWRIKFSEQDVSRYDYWKRMEFTKDQWFKLKSYCDSQEIIFLSSPFSAMAFRWLEEMDVPAWKLASGEVHNAQMLELLVKSKKPVIMSSGLSTVKETHKIAQGLMDKGLDVAVLHCTTQYPTQAGSVGMNVMEGFRDTLSCPVGLSDHSGEIFPSIVATYEGASIIEVHLTLHEQMFGPDVSSSLNPQQLCDLVKGCAFSWVMRGNPVNKSRQLEGLVKERTIFGRSLVAARQLEAGAIIGEDDLCYKKPGGGLTFEQRDSLIGKRVITTIEQDGMMRLVDVE